MLPPLATAPKATQARATGNETGRGSPAARPPSTVASAPMTATVLSGDEPSLAARTSETSKTSKQAANQVSVNMASIAG